MDDGLERTDWFDMNGWTGGEDLVWSDWFGNVGCKEKVGWLGKGDWEEEEEDCEGTPVCWTTEDNEGNGNEGDDPSFFNWEYAINGEYWISLEKSNETPVWFVGVESWFFVYR